MCSRERSWACLCVSFPQEQLIANDALIPLAHAIDMLANARDDNEDLDASVIEQQNAVISSSVQVHLKLPVAKGSGHGNVEHVAACFAYSALLETSGLEAFQAVSLGACLCNHRSWH